jgi:hypothetical protein
LAAQLQAKLQYFIFNHEQLSDFRKRSCSTIITAATFPPIREI